MSRCQLRQSWSALLVAVTPALVAAAPGSPADSSSPASRMYAGATAPLAPPAPSEPLGLRTDRLSGRQRERWQSILELVLAKDDAGRPLHPTLWRMGSEVAASGHEVYVELPAPSLSVCTTAGLFRIESVRPDGHIVAVLQLNLKTIDRARLADATRHGFPLFHGLEQEGRYVEVLGHELGHAVWTLADPERARDVLALRTRLAALGGSLRKAKREERPEIMRRLTELGEQIEALEPLARAAEARVWQELVAGQAASAGAGASSSGPGPGPESPRLSGGKID